MKTLALFLAFAALPAAMFSANAEFSIPGGSQSATFVISKPGNYVLTASRVMTDNSKNAIEVTVPDVTIDLNGCALTFATANSGSGSAINIPTAVNVEIRNGSLTNVPLYAIRSEGATGSGLRIIDVRIAGSRGIASKAAGTLVDRCHVVDTQNASAIWITGLNPVIRYCQIRNVSSGGGIVTTGGAQIVDNVIDNVAIAGIYLGPVNASEAGGMVIRNLVRKANQLGSGWNGGITVYGVGVAITDNVVHGCKGTGISALGQGTLVERNHIVASEASAAISGPAIYSQFQTTIMRNNTATQNPGGLLQGVAINGGGNVTS